MTNNEAARWIQLYIDLAKFDPSTGEEAYLNEDDRKTLEAMEIARDALTCNQLATDLQPSKQDADDTISRQAAIDALYDWSEHSMTDAEAWHIKQVIGDIKSLPSAQPETIRCKDCKHRREDECPMYHVEWVEYDDDGYIESDDVIYDYTEDDGYCHMAERRTDE